MEATLTRRPKTRRLKPNRGPQEQILACDADIAIFGGSAGCGKSWSLAVEPLRNRNNPRFSAAIFRRSFPEITRPGGLWEEAGELYPHFGGDPRYHDMTWRFPSGAQVTFGHLQHEKTKFQWLGAQIPLICFDELTTFTETQFWYLFSRNRSVCGVRPYIRATCNADGGSWVANFIEWWIDRKTGYPIPERSGRKRWMVRIEDKIHWSDDPEELRRLDPTGQQQPKSVTFIAAYLSDNPVLVRKDPSYLATLNALPLVERERLKNNNWKITPTAGNVFRREWFRLTREFPRRARLVRYWDKAGSEKKTGDFSAGVLMGELDNQFYVIDVQRGQWTPGQRNRIIKETAESDEAKYGRGKVELWIEREPMLAGKESTPILLRDLREYAPHFDQPNEAKVTRAMPLSAQAEGGNVFVLTRSWTEDYIEEMVNFPPENDKGNDDQVDGSSGAFNKLVRSKQPSSGMRPTGIKG